jgi:hypothetical protein
LTHFWDKVDIVYVIHFSDYYHTCSDSGLSKGVTLDFQYTKDIVNTFDHIPVTCHIVVYLSSKIINSWRDHVNYINTHTVYNTCISLFPACCQIYFELFNMLHVMSVWIRSPFKLWLWTKENECKLWLWAKENAFKLTF